MDSEHSQPTALAWAERAESFRKMTATATGGNPPRVRPDLPPPPRAGARWGDRVSDSSDGDGWWQYRWCRGGGLMLGLRPPSGAQ